MLLKCIHNPRINPSALLMLPSESLEYEVDTRWCLIHAELMTANKANPHCELFTRLKYMLWTWNGVFDPVFHSAFCPALRQIVLFLSLQPKRVAPCLQGVLASLSSKFSRAAATVLFWFTSLTALFWGPPASCCWCRNSRKQTSLVLSWDFSSKVLRDRHRPQSHPVPTLCNTRWTRRITSVTENQNEFSIDVN